ncbi:MAG: HDOD domain-containing protein [Planctomycetes bacterium]|nr:HDOD domain-containing protein [Planctomycetota bacterium]NOG53975.1 HDOD domain-containing protein [Planctomycetota bacterium]
MASTWTQERESAVNDALLEVSHIATLPEITLKIIELVEDPTSTAQDLHKVITNDPALCSRILKVVNSAFYGLPGQIGSINRAIVLLGLNAVKNIAIATSLAKLFRGGELCEGFSARDLWVHSTGAAAAAKLIADSAGIGLSDEAFLGGLLHDIGIMVEMQTSRHKLIEVFEKFNPDGSNGDFLEIEESIFGANHQDFGRGLCEKWRFPKSFSYVTGYHHNPLELEPGVRTLACVIHLADKLAALEHIGFTGDVMSTDVDSMILEDLCLSSADLQQIHSDLPQSLEQVQTMLG